MKKLIVGLVGAGAVVEELYLPVLSKNSNFQIEYLIDTNLDRARELAEKYKIPKTADDYKQIITEVEAAMIAVPNHLHAPFAIDLMKNGVHVLVEKPMANTSQESISMIEASNRYNKQLAVGLVRRYYEINRIVKDILSKKLIGKIKKVDYQEGNISRWETASDYLFRKDKGGGVLASIGIYPLDLMSWWFDGVKISGYTDDSEGGVDANGHIQFTNHEEVDGQIKISRTRMLSNSFKIEGTSGYIEGGIKWDSPLKLNLRDTEYDLTFNSEIKKNNKFTLIDAFELQIKNFYQSIRTQQALFIPGEEGMNSVRLLEECLKVRKKLIYPWEEEIKKIKNGSTTQE
jgi:predicted dehydrogenase